MLAGAGRGWTAHRAEQEGWGMSVVPEGLQHFERPSFADGQRLTAADLSAVQAFTQQGRWLHNRTLHDWGIVRGLVVDGRAGDREVVVGPGFALDAQGREIVLTDARTVAVPSVGLTAGGADGTYALTVCYATDASLPLTPALGGGRGAVRRIEEPLLRWQNPNDRGGEAPYRPGLDLVLATVQIRGPRIVAISPAQRRHVEPVSRPFIAGGETPKGGTRWRTWETDRDGTRVVLGLMTQVDTSWVGFKRQPAYLANVVGDRVFQEIQIDGVPGPFPIDGITQVLDPSPSGFTLALLLPRDLQAGGVTINSNRLLENAAFERVLRDIRQGRGWYVSWLGVEV
jgi:hypothetical protein